jgi:hypothetical protein
MNFEDAANFAIAGFTQRKREGSQKSQSRTQKHKNSIHEPTFCAFFVLLVVFVFSSRPVGQSDNRPAIVRLTDGFAGALS